MDWIDKLSAKKGVVGIEILPDGLAVVAKGCHGKDSEFDAFAVLTDDAGSNDRAKELENFVDKHRLSKRMCNLVLAQKDYQLLLVEAPDVPDDEIRNAIRWRIKDLISIPVEKAAIDIFFLPQDGNRASKKMIYVVVSDIEYLKQLVEMVNGSGLTLASIDIPEMALRNVGFVKSREHMGDRGLAIARVVEGGGSVSLYRQGNLYLSRQFKLDYSGGLLDELPTEALTLEVQRSLDYYERQMGLAPPAVLYICGENISEDKIHVDITRGITAPTQYLSMSEELAVDESVEESMVHLCIGALGGIYRDLVSG